MNHQFFIFYEGATNWWSCINVVNSQVKYVDLINYFLEKLKENKNELITIDKLNVTIMTAQENKIVLNLDDNIPIQRGIATEILLTLKQNIRQNKKIATIQQYPLQIIEEGKKFLEKKDYKSAMEFFIAADVFGSLDLIRILYKLEQWTQIESYFPRLLVIFSGYPEVYMIYGACLEHYNMLLKALHQYRRALSFAENPEINAAIARIHFLKGDITTAKLIIDDIIDNNDYNPVILKVAIEIAITLEDYETAIQYSLRHPKCYKLLADICCLSKGSITFCENLKNYHFTPEGLCKVSSILYKNGCSDVAIKMLISKEAGSDKDIYILSYLLWFLLLERNFTLFINCLQAYCALNPFKSLGNILISEIDSMLRSIKDENSHSYYKNSFIDTKIESSDIDCFFLSIIYIFFTQQFFLPEARALYQAAAYNIHHCRLVKEFYDAYRVISKIYDSKIPLEMCEHACLKYSIPIVGDEFSFMCGRDATLIFTEFFYFRSLFIPALSITDILDPMKTAKQKFLVNLESVADQRNIVVVLGTIDCEEVLPKLWRRCGISSIQEYLHNLVDGYVSILRAYIERHNNVNIYVHPAFIRSTISEPICTHFNRMLKCQCYLPVHYLEKMECKLYDSESIEEYQRQFRTTMKDMLITQPGLIDRLNDK